MKLLLLPLREELRLFSQALQKKWKASSLKGPTGDALFFADKELIVAQGGLGKVEMALSTQAWLLFDKKIHAMACVGCAGSLTPQHAIGTVIIASETVEHDFKTLFFKKPPPAFPIGPRWKTLFQSHSLFGIVASGDEDILSAERRQEVHNATGAVAAAWEGAGAARACRHHHVDFCEVRAISDDAQSLAKNDFRKNLETGMNNLADLFLETL